MWPTLLKFFAFLALCDVVGGCSAVLFVNWLVKVATQQEGWEQSFWRKEVYEMQYAITIAMGIGFTVAAMVLLGKVMP